MDVFPAFVLAGFIVRFVTSARDILAAGQEDIKHSKDSDRDIAELEAIVKEISAIQGSSPLANYPSFDPGNHPKPQHEALAKLCEECSSLHKDVRTSIEQLQSDAGTREHEASCATRKFGGKYGENHELDKRLQELERQIGEYLPSYMLSQRNATEKWVQELAETSRRLNINRSKELQQLITDTEIAFKNLSNQLSTVEYGGQSLSRGRMGSPSTVSVEKSAGNIILAFSSIAQQERMYATECHIIRSLASNEQKPDLSGKDKHGSPAFDHGCTPSTNCSVPDHLNEWLENGREIFWISGGPGCGKSTFMEYLSICPKTKDRLLRWARISPVFYTLCRSQNPQTKTRYSINDLLSTITCQILKRVPELIAVAFHDKWAYVMGTWGRPLAEVTFSREDLTHAIESLSLLENSNARFCFFIDGLDQFEGLETEVITYLKCLSTSPSIKICVTSRLEGTTLDSPGSDHAQRLHLPDFTNPSIDQHITRKLDQTSWIAQRRSSDACWFDQVFQYLRKESNGSFTWIDLVLSAALSGMKILDGLNDLLARLKQLPTDLRELFLHMLNDVQEEFSDQQARILLIASQAQEPLDVLAFSFLDEVEPDSTMSREAVPMEQQEVESRSQSAKRRVLSLCRSILDVLPASENSSSRELVIFPHSSIRDYLQGIEAREILTQRLKRPFNTQKKVCNSLLAQIKFHQMGPFWEEGGPIHGLVQQFLEEVRMYEITSDDVLGTQINELEEVVCQRKGNTFWWWQKRSVEKGESTSTFLELMIRCQLVRYLRWRFEHFPNITPGPLEMGNLLESTLTPADGSEVDSDMAKLFLDHGADPNYPSDHGYHLDAKPTPWRLFLLHLTQSAQNQPGPMEAEDQGRFLVLEHLIDAGADLETPVYPAPRNGPSNSTSRLSVDEVIQMTISRVQASILCRLIKERRNQRSAKSVWLGWR